MQYLFYGGKNSSILRFGCEVLKKEKYPDLRKRIISYK